MSFTDFLMLIFGVLFILGMIVSTIHDWKQDDKLYKEEKKRKNIEAEKLNSVEVLHTEIIDLLDTINDLNNRMDELFNEIDELKGTDAYVDNRSVF